MPKTKATKAKKWWQEVGETITEDLDLESFEDDLHTAVDTMLEVIGITRDNDEVYEDFHDQLCEQLESKVKERILATFK